jgi:hypothetical protein
VDLYHCCRAVPTLSGNALDAMTSWFIFWGHTNLSGSLDYYLAQESGRALLGIRARGQARAPAFLGGYHREGTHHFVLVGRSLA